MCTLKIENNGSNYKLEEILGEGTYGIVYKAVEVSSGRFVAIKRTKPMEANQGISSVNLREVCFLRSLKHPNIVSLQGIIYTPSSLDLIFEYLCCDLRQFIDKQNPPITERIIKKFLQQILTALHYCHMNRIIHRDLKPQNLLIDRSLNIKIADFGLARSYSLPIKPYTPCVQTLWYRAPEVLLGSKVYSTAIDIWSVGCIFSEMLMMCPPFTGTSERDVCFSIFNRLGTPNEENWPGVSSLQFFCKDFPAWNRVTLADIYTQLSPEGIDLLSRMIAMNPEKRISAHDALNHVIHIQPYLKVSSY